MNKTINLKDIKIEFKADSAMIKITNTTQSVLAFSDHSEYRYGSFSVKDGRIYLDESIQMQAELKHYNFLMAQQTIQRSFPIASNGKITIDYVKINKSDLKSVFIFGSQAKESLEEPHPKRLPYRNPKAFKELEKAKEGIVWKPSFLREEFESPFPPPQKILSLEEKEYPMVDPAFFSIIEGKEAIPIWIISIEGGIARFFKYGKDLRQTQPMDDQRYHGFATHKINLPKSEVPAFLECIKKGSYEVKVVSDVIVKSEIRVYQRKNLSPLTKEEIDARLQDIEMRTMRQTLVPPPPEAGSKSKVILFYDLKKREVLYQSQDRAQQEGLLLEMEKSLIAKYEAADRYTAEQLAKDVKAFKEQCERMIEEAKRKVSEGQDKQTVFDQTVKNLRDLENRMRRAWKWSAWPIEKANAEEYIQKLEIEKAIEENGKEQIAASSQNEIVGKIFSLADQIFEKRDDTSTRPKDVLEKKDLSYKIWQLAENNREIIPRVLSSLEDKNPKMRLKSAMALWAIGRGPMTPSMIKEAHRALRKALKDSDPNVREYAQKALKRLKDE